MDLLGLAVSVASRFFDREVPEHIWWDLSIHRLLTDKGWLVSGARHTFIYDDELSEVAA